MPRFAGWSFGVLFLHPKGGALTSSLQPTGSAWPVSVATARTRNLSLAIDSHGLTPLQPQTQTDLTDASEDDFAEWDALCATLPKGIFRTVVDGLETDDD